LEAKEEVSMSNRKYTEEFKSEAVKQVTDRGYDVREVADRLGVSLKSMYTWVRAAKGSNGRRGKEGSEDLRGEIQRLKAELKRVEGERDILKKAAAYFAKASQ
jgi:transposase